MLSPEDIQDRDFLVSLRGFDRAEVRSFLSEVAAQVRDLQARVEEAEAEAEQAAQDLEEGAAAHVEDHTAQREDAPRYFADIGRETQRILEAAQEAAESIARQARVDADREVQSARRQAARLIAEGEQRREEAEAVVAGLEAARGALSSQLREISATVERVIGELAGPPPPAATVREALKAGLPSAPAPAAAPAPVEPPESEAGPGEPPEYEGGPGESLESAGPGERPEFEGGPGEPPESEAGPGEPLESQVGEQPAEPAGVEQPDTAGDGEERPVDDPQAAVDEMQAAVHDMQAAADAAEAAEAVETTAAAEAAEAIEVFEAMATAEAIEADEVTEDPSDPHGLRASALAPLQPQLVRVIKRGLQDVQNVALERLRRSGDEGDLESLLPEDEEIAGIAAAATELLEQAYAEGSAVASLLVDRELPQPAGARELVSDFQADAGARIRNPLAATLRMARSAGEETQAWFDRVGAVFAELRGTVAEELAATHLLRAYELGLVDAWAAGGVTHRRWVLGREPRCPEARCRQNGQAGVLVMGAAYPSGHEVPPVHVGCNCTTIPVSEPPA